MNFSGVLHTLLPNLIDISQNLNIHITGETNKRSVFRLIQKLIDGNEGEEQLIVIEGFEKEFVADFVADGNKDETK